MVIWSLVQEKFLPGFKEVRVPEKDIGKVFTAVSDAFLQYQFIGIIANTRYIGVNLIRDIRRENRYIARNIHKNKSNSVLLKSGCNIIATPLQSFSFRGHTIKYLIIYKPSMMNEDILRQFKESIYPTMRAGTVYIIE